MMTTMNEAALKSSNGPSPTNGVLPEPSFDDGHSSGRFFLLDDFKDFYDLLPITIKQTGSLGMVIRQRELTLPTGRVVTYMILATLRLFLLLVPVRKEKKKLSTIRSNSFSLLVLTSTTSM